MSTKTSDITVIGGGVVGLSVAIGLLRAGNRVTVLDGADGDPRASQGNFGLVWLQGKGASYAPYAHLTSEAVSGWPEFASLIEDLSGVNLSLDQSGGYEFFTEEAEFRDFAADLKQQQQFLGNHFSFETIQGDDLRRSHPQIGAGVVGATFSALDGHVNPLRLLKALKQAVAALGGEIVNDAHVTDVSGGSSGFDFSLRSGAHHGADRVVLAAGLGAATLAERLGFQTRVRPQRGELLITEKLSERLPFLSSTIRQTDEGGLQIGGTKADAGYDDSETLDVMAGLAQHAVTVLPTLHDLRVVRAWGALRVMSPDGHPVYARSSTLPGAYLVTCHSGVTLAPFHGGALAQWIDDTTDAPNLGAFDEDRFTLSPAA
ncbi:FAD-binding oxidoreductase [Shimia litoralis]|uniref:FAD-binding oxidoreductase n=1 Tax=Shimia litoralis TaxID=420403 RepID=A0A4U7N4H6_9RHOB|nr:FAD-dependent oxidoreductase [Shimia litoralis]TKZ20498.1 FAD-binding oxidoreductase [Shimia litoralis]